MEASRGRKTAFDFVEAVVLDVNGTLFDDFSLSYEATKAIFAHFGLSVPTMEQFREISTDYMKWYRGHGVPETATRKDLCDIRRRVFRENWDVPVLRKDAFSVAEKLHSFGIKTAIVSGEDENIFEDRVRQLGLDKFFFPMLSGVHDKRVALREVADLLGLHHRMHKMIYVDDSHDGIRAALESGMKAFGITTGYASMSRILSAGPTCMIKRLSEVPEILEDYDLRLALLRW